jgi:hypothetical protein
MKSFFSAPQLKRDPLGGGNSDVTAHSMRTLGRFVRTWPFLTLGLSTFGFFVAVEVLGEPLRPLVPILRVLIVPLWLMRTLEMIVGLGFWPWPIQLPLALPLLFVPYIAADLLLRRARQWYGHRVAAA